MKKLYTFKNGPVFLAHPVYLVDKICPQCRWRWVVFRPLFT